MAVLRIFMPMIKAAVLAGTQKHEFRSQVLVKLSPSSLAKEAKRATPHLNMEVAVQVVQVLLVVLAVVGFQACSSEQT